MLFVAGIVYLNMGDKVRIELSRCFKGIDGLVNKVCNVLLHDGVLASKGIKCGPQIGR